MKCPYCKNELTEGFINRPDSTFQFFPGDLRPNFFRTKWHVTKNAILIKPYKKREFRLIILKFLLSAVLYVERLFKILI